MLKDTVNMTKTEHNLTSGVHYGIWILIVGMLTIFGCIGLGRFAMGMILHTMGEELALSNTLLGIIVSANFFGYLTSTMVCGALAVKFGPRAVIGVAMILVAIGMGVAGVANGFLTAFIAQLLIGLGAGGSNIPTLGLIAKWYAEKVRGTANGLLTIGSGLGFALAGILVPSMIAAYGNSGWRSSWFTLGGMVVVVALLGITLNRNDPSEKGLDPIGNSEADVHKPRPHVSIREIYASRVLWELGFIYSMFGFSYVVFTTFFATYLVEHQGFGEAQAGKVWMLVGLVSIGSGFLWGLLSDKLGRRNTLIMVYALQGVFLLMIALANNPLLIIIDAVLYALTLWSVPSIMSATCADYVGHEFAPAALGMVTVFFGVGQMMSPWISGYLSDMTHNFAMPFFMSAAAGTTGSILTLLLPKRT